MSEAGLPDFTFVGWIGLFAPAGTPRPIIDRIAKETASIVGASDFKARLEQIGAEARPMQGEPFAAFVRQEVARLPRLLKEIGIEPQ